MFRLLIADDEANIREGLAKHNWSALGIEPVYDCNNGLEALRYIMENPVDIVLTDIMMPFMGGLELSEQINQLFPFVKVVILTGYNDFEFVRSSLRSGVADYLLKPTLQDELDRVFHGVVNELQLEQSQKTVLLSLKRKALLLQRKEFLQKLLFMPLSADEIEWGCAEGSIQLNAPDFRVAVIQLDGKVRADYSIKDWELILFAFENTLSEIWDERGHGYHLVEAETGLCLLLTAGDSDKLLLRAEDIRNHFYRFRGLFKSTLSIGIGETVSHISEVLLSGEQAERVLAAEGEERLSVYEIKDVPFMEASGSVQQDSKVEAIESEGHIISAAKQYIQKHFKEPISLKEISQQVHVNSSYLSYLFKKSHGENYVNYLTTCRMDEAKRLLSDPQYKIYEVSERIGYRNTKHFSIIFKRYTGLTPYDYRSGKSKT
ncbi:response regulator [Paenibacillus psychroresistens]|uniref:Response regulator n=1 Tax=Paenibacillus psychroresistens TaxID=1778678 RepID=A0A6B8RC55_9BACL|nr:response regulator [Paenibacillus psychroresistens]QGQ94101.1 response regulator [Paenibacillus psychroresistens]